MSNKAGSSVNSTPNPTADSEDNESNGKQTTPNVNLTVDSEARNESN